MEVVMADQDKFINLFELRQRYGQIMRIVRFLPTAKWKKKMGKFKVEDYLQLTTAFDPGMAKLNHTCQSQSSHTMPHFRQNHMEFHFHLTTALSSCCAQVTNTKHQEPVLAHVMADFKSCNTILG